MNSAKQRIGIVDATRGLALFGMLVANVGVFTTSQSTNGNLNEIASSIYSIAFLHNYYIIFSILFGLSFYIFMDRPQNSRFIFVKRNFFLLLIGLVHLVFLWHIDILHAYALTGFLLIIFYNMKLRSIKIWIIILLLVDIVISNYLASRILEFLPQIDSGSFLVESYSAETYVENLQITFMNITTAINSTIIKIPHYLFLFLVGLYIGKSGIYRSVYERKEEIKSACRVSVAALIAITVIWIASINTINHETADIAEDLFNVILGICYIPLFVLLYINTRNNYIFSRLEIIGKMTLTSYLSHSVLYLIFFYQCGLGLYLEYPTYTVPLIVIPVFIIQAELSRLWLNRYEQGPVEKLWRFLTYSTIKPKPK